MHQTNKIIVLFCLVVFILFGCKPETVPVTTQTQFWTTWPKINAGTIEFERLTVQPWNSGRLEATSGNTFAETESGYYYCSSGVLFYADKTDLEKWVPVCKKPNCTHGATTSCNAYLLSNTFVIRDGRIYFSAHAELYPHLYSGKERGFALFSKAVDGTDTRLEYLIEEAMIGSGGGSCNTTLTSEHWINRVEKMNNDGSFSARCYRITDEGKELLYDETLESDYSSISLPVFLSLRGDALISNRILGGNSTTGSRFENGELVTWDMANHIDTMRYLSGKHLRIFRINDGYYDVDLETGSEIRVADAYLENSDCVALLPNCIIETTLFYSVESLQTFGEKHEMALYDGTQWRNVTLPKELARVGSGAVIGVHAVASDRVFLSYTKNGVTHLYSIPLDAQTLALEYCGKLSC